MDLDKFSRSGFIYKGNCLLFTIYMQKGYMRFYNYENCKNVSIIYFNEQDKKLNSTSSTSTENKEHEKLIKIIFKKNPN